MEVSVSAHAQKRIVFQLLCYFTNEWYKLEYQIYLIKMKNANGVRRAGHIAKYFAEKKLKPPRNKSLLEYGQHYV